MSDWSNLKWTAEDERLVKLWFSPEHLSGMFGSGIHTHEIAWAKPLDNGLYEMREPMFRAHGVSPFDKVSAFLDDEGLRQVLRIVEKSGYRTIKVIIFGGAIADEFSYAIEKWLFA